MTAATPAAATGVEMRRRLGLPPLTSLRDLLVAFVPFSTTTLGYIHIVINDSSFGFGPTGGTAPLVSGYVLYVLYAHCTSLIVFLIYAL